MTPGMLNNILLSNIIVQYIILYNIILFIVGQKKYCSFIYCKKNHNILTIYCVSASNGQYHMIETEKSTK